MNENDKRLCERIVKRNMDQGLYAAWTFICLGNILAVLNTLAWLFVPGAPTWGFGVILAVIAIGTHLKYQDRLYRIIKHQAKALERERLYAE